MQTNIEQSNDWLFGFRSRLIEWGKVHFRAFPWRKTQDPYAILMAEIMLHRTQVQQVVPVYQRFLKRYPSLEDLFQATPEGLQETLSSLGLHWRIELIETMAATIQEHYQGKIPQERDELLRLPGISQYIAGALRCFAWGFPEALIDTNTVRIAGRVMGLPVKDSSRRNALFRQILQKLLDEAHPREFNYAMIDLAHLVCLKKQAPLCEHCPVLPFCNYGRSQIIPSESPPEAI